MPSRLLLSQSQVSVVVSSTVVVVFTLLLFLAGYSIQQREVQGLKIAIQPRIPKAPQSLATSEDTTQQHFEPSRLFGKRDGRIAYTDFDRHVHSSGAGANINWQRLAHVQLVRRHHDVCSAIMVLAELHRMRSPAKRVLLFPKAWAEEKKAGKGDISDPYLDSTRRLMKLAARRYHVNLQPIDPIRTSDDGDTYSLASAYALTHDFDRLLTIETPGLLLDAEPLDAILGFSEKAPFVMLHDTNTKDGVHSEDLFLLEPSKSRHAELTKRLVTPEMSQYNDTHLSTLLTEAILLASSNEDTALIRSVGALHDVGPDFNKTSFMSGVAYIRFSDPKLPGPEYEVPWADKVAARPKNKDADWAWTSLYGDFAQKRMEICGLDLETWRKY
ncbi:Glucose N-acetyltransferase 1 [Fulvia fulva]|nr:Glucose N-acetyltransferase 1 [Fulvia fulva]WPV15003.1 Glucose N-acetyltransferase 1 [Fulvia fulva]WPV29436.1 Glucose N-acetyltransferase 1 [Fulvia fulva]